MEKTNLQKESFISNESGFATEKSSVANTAFSSEDNSKYLNRKGEDIRLKSVSYSKYGYIFIAPFFLAFLIFQLYPIIYSLAISLTDLSYATDFAGTSQIVGFENYVFIFNHAAFWSGIINTILIWSINFVPQLVAAYLFAAIFSSAMFKIKGAGAFKVIYYLPNIITATSVALLFKQMGEKHGILWDTMKSIGLINEAWSFGTANPINARVYIAFIQFWRYFGYTMITLVAGMLGINPTYYEAATIDGAGRVKMFFSITLPLLKPITLYTLITSLVGGLQMFEIPFLMYDGKPTAHNGSLTTFTVACYIYNLAFPSNGDYHYGRAGAASGYLFIISAILSFITFKFFGKEAFGIDKPDKEKKKKLKTAKGV